MKDYIILNGHRKFCDIQPENKALKLIWSCRHDEDSAEILGKPSKKFCLRETLTLSMCTDSRTKINPIWHVFFGIFLATFGIFFALLALFSAIWVYFAFVANGEVACHSQALRVPAQRVRCVLLFSAGHDLTGHQTSATMSFCQFVNSPLLTMLYYTGCFQHTLYAN